MCGLSAGLQGEAGARQSRAEMPGILEQARAQLGGVVEKVEHSKAHTGDDGRNAVGKEVRGGALAQPLDYFLTRGNVAAARATQRLAERTGEDVDPVRD